MQNRGCFITLEGIEGCGKSTHARKLRQALEERGWRTLLTREPGGTRLGSEIRKLLLRSRGMAIGERAELLLYAADRQQHLEEVVLPALKSGNIVICDRFSDATAAYQGHARGLDRELIEQIERLVCGDLKPRLTLLLDLPVRVGLQRALQRNQAYAPEQREDRFEQEGPAFHEKVRRGYLALARAFPERIRLIDAAGSIEQVHRNIMKEVLPVLAQMRI